MTDIKCSKDHQLKLGTLLLMFTWQVLWSFNLIYVLARLMIPEGDTNSIWLLLRVSAFYSGVEMVIGLLLLRCVGYEINPDSLRTQILWRTLNGWRARNITTLVLLLVMIVRIMMRRVNRALASVSGFVTSDWWPIASNPVIV